MRAVAAALGLAAATACAADAPAAPPPAPTTAAPPATDPVPSTVPAPAPAPAVASVPTTVVTTTTTVAPPHPHPPSTTVAPPDPHPPSQTARASWYGAESGSRTADGTAFDGSQMVFAHRTMAFGTHVRFCHAGACVVARCADRGPAAWTGKDFDLSRAAFAAIAPLSRGVVTVTWEAA